MRARFVVSGLPFVVVVLLASVPSLSRSQTGAAPVRAELVPFVGCYRNPHADGGAAVIRSAVMAGTAEMAAVRRRIARRRILETETPIEVLTITPEGNGLIVDLGHGRRNATPTLGTFFTAPTADGGTVKVKLELVQGRLQETYGDPDGGAVQHFALSPDGSVLSFDSTITSPHLPGPIRYSLELERLH